MCGLEATLMLLKDGVSLCSISAVIAFPLGWIRVTKHQNKLGGGCQKKCRE